MENRSKIILRAENVSIGFGSGNILKNVSFEILNHKITTILGPAGVGKTQILRCIAGLSRPKEGSIEYGSQDVRIGYVFQDPTLIPWLTVWENFKIIHTNLNVMDSLIQDFGLSQYLSCYPKEISGGTKQKINLLRAVLGGGNLILLDEPFSGLDYGAREYFYDLLGQMRQRLNITILLVTHDIEEAVKLSDRIYFLSSKQKNISSVFEREKTKKFNSSEKELEDSELRKVLEGYFVDEFNSAI